MNRKLINLLAALGAFSLAAQAADNPPVIRPKCAVVETNYCAAYSEIGFLVDNPCCVPVTDTNDFPRMVSLTAIPYLTSRGMQRTDREYVDAYPGAGCSRQPETVTTPDSAGIVEIWTLTLPGGVSTSGVGSVASGLCPSPGMCSASFEATTDGRCVHPASTNIPLALVYATAEAGPWIGLDLTDAAGAPPTDAAIGGLTARCPREPSPTVTWSLSSPAQCELVPPVSGVELFSATIRSTPPNCSEHYLGEEVTMSVSHPGVSVSTNFTVVRVDVQLSGVSEEDEESMGGFVQHSEDLFPGWPAGLEATSPTGRCPMAALHVDVQPRDGAMPDELVQLSYTDDFASSVFTLEDGVWRPATNVYRVADLPGTFYIHGHVESAALRDKAFTAVHLASGAIDKANLTVFVVDLDIDGDNNNGTLEPDCSLREEFLEVAPDINNPLGKIIFANVNDDDADGVVDYSDLEIASGGLSDSYDERQFVPIKIVLGPQFINLTNATIKITYSGENEIDATMFDGRVLDNGFHDYRSAKKGIIRLWNIDEASLPRTTNSYVRPCVAYSATDFDFLQVDNGYCCQFYIEGINRSERDSLSLEVVFGEGFSGSDFVQFAVSEPNLGVNNTSSLVPSSMFRVGIPDENCWIDEADDTIEDQRGFNNRYGLHFWYRRDSGAVISNLGLVDLMPFVVEIPPHLLDLGFTFYLTSSKDELSVFPSVCNTEDRLAYFKDAIKPQFKTPLANEQTQMAANYLQVRDSKTLLPICNDVTEYLFGIENSDDSMHRNIITLYAKEPRGDAYIPVDSFVLTVKPTSAFFEMASIRDAFINDYDYPLDPYTNGLIRVESIGRYGDAVILANPKAGELPIWDSSRKQCVVYLHGYNIKEGYVGKDFDVTTAGGEASEFFRRLYWAGYRGNFIAFTWHGNEDAPVFSANVANAFQSAQSLRNFLVDYLCGTRALQHDAVSLVAHSLGCQVAVDALRLNQIAGYGTTNRIARILTLIEPAIWSESFFKKGPVVYSHPSSPITYSIDDLCCNSWAYYFNNDKINPKKSINYVVQSYNRHDYALWIMIADDIYVRNAGIGHYYRPTIAEYNENDLPLFPRLATAGGYASIGAAPYAFNLAYNIPAMLKLGRRHLLYGIGDVLPPAGQQDIPIFADSIIDASDHGWYKMAHGDHKAASYLNMGWIIGCDGAVEDNGETDDDLIASMLNIQVRHKGASLPRIWSWLMGLLDLGAFRIGE